MTSNPNHTVSPAEVAPAQDFGWALSHLARNYQNACASIVEGFPHGARGYQVLLAVNSGDLPNQLALAQHLGIDRTVMTYLLDDFVEAGIVERQLNPRDRRARLVVPTNKGTKLLVALQSSMANAERSVLSALDSEDQELFRSLLARIARSEPVKSSGNLDPCAAIEALLDS